MTNEMSFHVISNIFYDFSPSRVTDGRTERRDGASYRGAMAHLKMKKVESTLADPLPNGKRRKRSENRICSRVHKYIV